MAWMAVAATAEEDPRFPHVANVRAQLKALHREIARHDELYHRKAAPEIDDFDYDQLKRRLAELEKAFPELAGAVPRPTEIGDDRSGVFPTRPHRERMLSLDKAYEPAELRAFHARLVTALAREDLAYVVEPKFDGVAVSVTFENGELVHAVTRGDGAEGDDITANVRNIPGLPSRLGRSLVGHDSRGWPEMIELRGEIYVPFAAFARVNAEREAAGEPPFANPRNLAAGTVRQKDAAAMVERGLRLVFYGIGACEPAAVRPARQRDLASTFAAWGLPHVEQSWTARGAQELVAAVEAVQRARPGFAFPTDGAVVKLDDWSLQRALGVSESAPRWAVAYKFPPKRAETQVRAITLQVGRTGVLTPVAELAPVELAGSTIARATLHNRAELARNDVRVGDFVWVEKAGEIIPAIVGVNRARRAATSESYAFPAECPGCGESLKPSPTEATVRCANADCPAQLGRRLEHFAGRECLDIAGLGPATINLLVKTKAVKSLPDIYRLQQADLVTHAKLGRKSADELLREIERSKRAELARLVHGLGMPKIGAVHARAIATRCGSLEDLLNFAGEDSIDRAVAAYFAEPRHRALVMDLIALGVQPRASGSIGPAAGVAGRVFALTGTLPTLTRDEARALIETAGGLVRENVARTTNYLVAGSEPGAKLEHAKRLGVAVIDEAALKTMLAQE